MKANMQVECHYCGQFVDADATTRRKIEDEVGRIGGAISFGGRSGTGTSSSTNRSGSRLNSGTGSRRSAGTIWRFSGGRKIYKKITVRICQDCLAAEAETRKRIRKIIAAVIVLLLICWAVAELLSSVSHASNLT